MGKLTALSARSLREPGRYADGGNLYLVVGEGNAKSWLFMWRHDGRRREMGLGPFKDITLAEAREKAAEARKRVLAGIDPIAAKKRPKSLSFEAAAEQFIESHRAGWRNAKHAAQWANTLSTYAYPIIGDQPVASIDTDAILRILRPIWTDKTETANRVRGRIEQILDWARARGLRNGDNPARWRGHLDKLLPSPRRVSQVKHHSALPYKEVPSFLARIRASDGVAARALEFVVLTAARTGEVISAEWGEIDFRARMWNVPGSRMKGGRDHRVPLSVRALEILREMKALGSEQYVFPGPSGAPLSNMALAMLLRRVGVNVTVHGFRSTFKDWATEQTDFANEVSEMALAHRVSDKVEAAYRRGDLLEKRRELADAWATYCAGARVKRRKLKKSC